MNNTVHTEIAFYAHEWHCTHTDITIRTSIPQHAQKIKKSPTISKTIYVKVIYVPAVLDTIHCDKLLEIGEQILS